MKKFILFLLCMLSFGFSQDKEVRSIDISLSLEEEESLTADILRVDIFVNASGNKEIDVVNMLGEVDKAVKSLGFEYSGGNYWVQKNCWWERDKRRCEGFLGELRYSFRLQKASDQNRLLDLLDAFKEKFGKAINYTVSQTIWVVSNKKTEGLKEELRLRLLDKARDFATKAGKRLGKECHIQSVSYEHISPIRGDIGLMTLKSASEAPEPKMEEISTSVRAIVGLVCR
ncbi:MAG: hypothetical protein ACK4VK_05280 [Aquificaceae bacterium]